MASHLFSFMSASLIVVTLTVHKQKSTWQSAVNRLFGTSCHSR